MFRSKMESGSGDFPFNTTFFYCLNVDIVWICLYVATKVDEQFTDRLHAEILANLIDKEYIH